MSGTARATPESEMLQVHTEDITVPHSYLFFLALVRWSLSHFLVALEMTWIETQLHTWSLSAVTQWHRPLFCVALLSAHLIVFRLLL